MSKVVNEAKIKNKFVVRIRELLEHRAFWLYPLYLDFHYCPLVKAWQKAGCTDAEIARLCDIAMCGDHGIGKCFDAKLDLPKCIAKGDDVCALRYRKVHDGQGDE